MMRVGDDHEQNCSGMCQAETTLRHPRQLPFVRGVGRISFL